MASIFISYRRGVTDDITYRVGERLKARFPDVFIDIDNIPTGVRFTDHLAQVLGRCDVVLAIIGPDWVTPRLKDEADVLRQELEVSLERDIAVIPVLVRNASMPSFDQVPPSLHGLLQMQAFTVASGRDFGGHMEGLIFDIERISAEVAARRRAPEPEGPLPKALLEAVHSPHEGIRLGAIHSLSAMAPQDGSGSALEQIRILCGDPIESVANYARRELERHLAPPPPNPGTSLGPVTHPTPVPEALPAPDDEAPTSLSELQNELVPPWRKPGRMWVAGGATAAVALTSLIWAVNRSSVPEPTVAAPSATSSAIAATEPPEAAPPTASASVAKPVDSAPQLLGSVGDGAGPAEKPKPKTAPKVIMSKPAVSGNLPAEVISRIARTSYGPLRTCYEQGLTRDATLMGRATVRFVIARDGAVSNVSSAGSSLADADVLKCVRSSFYALSFPQPEGGIVTVDYPISFTPPQ